MHTEQISKSKLKLLPESAPVLSILSFHAQTHRNNFFLVSVQQEEAQAHPFAQRVATL